MAKIDTFSRLNFVRLLIVLAIGVGYASTMPVGPGATEYLSHFGYEPSWIGIQLLFFFSGFLALSSLRRRQSGLKYLTSKIMRTGPMLALCTLCVVTIIYPIFCAKGIESAATLKTLARYVFETVTCINPGQRLPGLLDEAKYMCLIQGAIWTLRWGLLAHIAVAIGWHFGLFSRRSRLVTYAILATLGYIGLFGFSAYTRNESFSVPLLGLRLSYPFLIGMAVYAYRDQLPNSIKAKVAWLFGLATFTSVNAIFLPWTPLIEVGLTLSWGYGAYLLMKSRISYLKWTEKCPHLALGLYLTIWPSAQILLLLNPSFTPLGLILTALPLAASLSVLTHYAIYGPTTALLTRKSSRKVTV